MSTRRAGVSTGGRETGRMGLSRPQVIWGVLVMSLTLVAGLLTLLMDTGGSPKLALPSASATVSAGSGSAVERAVSVSVEQVAWRGIVIHHSAATQGNAQQLDRLHREGGLAGLGYHFVIGNGRGSGDGQIEVGYRWDRQLPGAHVAGPNSEALNRELIGVCLVGNGDVKPFSEAQLASLQVLIAELQERYGLERDAVWLHRELAPTASPGRLFPAYTVRVGVPSR